MRIILLQPVEKLGVPGDVVTVADGYARNFLIPRGMATRAVKGAVRHADRVRRGHDERVRKELGEARARAERLSARPLRIPARAGGEGRLFGSITVADVARALEAASGETIDRRRVNLSEPIRSLGTHEATVHVHPEVDARVTVEVVPQ